MKKVKLICFWLLSCTWGIVMTLIGALIALALLVLRKEPQIFHGYVYFVVGKNWGGFNCGPFFFISSAATDKTKQHEAGHGIQNIIFGPLMPFVVSIPSAIRYWYRRYKSSKGLGYTLPSYDSIWFEGWATELGSKYFS